MGKIVKYCAACEEGFAEKFGFCPNCGSALAAYEMNPATTKPNGNAPEEIEPKVSAPIVSQSAPVTAPIAAKTGEPVTSNADKFSADHKFSSDDEFDLLDEKSAEEIAPAARVETVKAETTAPASVHSGFSQNFSRAEYAANGNGNGRRKTGTDNFAVPAVQPAKSGDGLYHITFVEEKNASGRNLLLLGAFLLVTTTVLGGVVYSLFKQNPYIGSLNDNDVSVVYTAETPEDPAVEPPKPKTDKKAGGGGGGGREEETPTSKGRLAPQMPDPPLITPTKTIEQKDFDLKYQATTVGPTRPVKPTDEKYGDPHSKFDIASDGSGSGGGQGSGRGSGQGSGIGTGQGSGIGSGSGSGKGNGVGVGVGDGVEGGGAPAPQPKPKPAPVTQAVSILSKPRPSYTDAARQNQVTGVVRLRVTFLASGQIGSVSPVSGLSYGLTEQAIAAAKQIKFEPAKANGVAQTVTKQIEYSFSIY